MNQTCPRCDYNHVAVVSEASAGNGLLYCKSCGGTWRDLGMMGVHAPLRRSAGYMPMATAAVPAMPARPAQATKPHRLGRVTLAVVGACCLLAGFVAGWHGLIFARITNQIEITDLSASQVQRYGKIAVRIEGRLSNRSSSPIALGGVDIVLSQASGHRIYSWVHRPAVGHIDPGQTIRFSTADGSVPEIATRVEIRAGTTRISAPL